MTNVVIIKKWEEENGRIYKWIAVAFDLTWLDIVLL